MTQEQIEEIKEAADELSLHFGNDDDDDADISLYENYSGRGMMGTTTTGLRVTSWALGVLKEKFDIRYDNLGKDYIVY